MYEYYFSFNIFNRYFQLTKSKRFVIISKNDENQWVDKLNLKVWF